MNKRTRILFFVALPVVAILIIAVVIIAALPSTATAIDLNAKLSELVGVVQVRDNPEANYNQVDNGYVLKTAMQLQTKEESRARLDLSTGSILRLGQLTVFSLDPPAPASGGVLSRIQMQVGKVWIVLNGGSLDVNTPAGLASVRGSYMSVWVERITNRITVCCLEGFCSYENAAGSVEMTSGQKIISSDPNVLPTVVKMDMSDIQDWIDNSPESASIVPQILNLVAGSTPSLTPTSTPTLKPNFTSAITDIPTATSTPTLTSTPCLGTYVPTLDFQLTPTQTYTPTATKYATSPPGVTLTPTATNTPTPTPTLTSTPCPGTYPPPLNLQFTPTPTRTPTKTRTVSPPLNNTPTEPPPPPPTEPPPPPTEPPPPPPTEPPPPPPTEPPPPTQPPYP